MIKVIIFDFSRVLLDFKGKNYPESLNSKYDELKTRSGFNIFNHFELNGELLHFARQNKSKYHLYVYTTGHIHNDPEIKKELDSLFEKIYSLEEIGMKKSGSSSYLKIAKLINYSPEEILFIDDKQENIDTADKAGFETIKYNNNNQLFKDIQTKLE
jgi:FMN phosphatase YigB (HAD superfamily)